MSIKLYLNRVVGRVLCMPFIGRIISFIYNDHIPSGNLRIDTTESVSSVTKAMIYWGIYESAELRLIRRHLKSDCDVIELGASLGVVTCNIRMKMEPARKLYCVEADPRLIRRVERNLELNGLRDGVVVINRAIDYGAESHSLFFRGQSNVAGKLGGDGDAENAISVPTVTLGQLIAENDVGRYTLICDIEGAEAGVLMHDKAALNGCVQMIIELHESRYHGTTYTKTELLSVLHEMHGFSPIDWHGEVYVLKRSQTEKSLSHGGK